MTGVSYERSGSSVGSMTYDYQDKTGDDNLGNRIEQIDYVFNGSASHSISYTYDNVGNVATTDVGGTNYGWAYGYDNIYQVTDADQGSATNRSVDFGYDNVYNRTSWQDTLDSINLSYSHNVMNQYTSVGSTTPTYDSRGNLTFGYGGGLTLVYDAENRLVSAGGLYNYGYDLLGRRKSMAIFRTVLSYVWDGPHVIAEYVNGSLTKKYIYGPGIDNPVAMIAVDPGTQEETWYYYYADALGSTRLMTDADGVIVESYTYDPFGQPLVMTDAGSYGNWLTEDGSMTLNGASAIGNPIMFTGRWWDSTHKLYYYRFRDYSPTLGRFLQPDPLGYIDGMNLYQYCGNNPVNWIDPWGLARRQERPLDSYWVLRYFTPGRAHHHRFLYRDGTDSGYYDDSRVREDWADKKLQGRYKNVGPELDDRLLKQAEDNLKQDWDRKTNPKATPYKLRGKGQKNCQDYCDAVEQEYERLRQEEELVKKLMQPWP